MGKERKKRRGIKGFGARKNLPHFQAGGRTEKSRSTIPKSLNTCRRGKVLKRPTQQNRQNHFSDHHHHHQFGAITNLGRDIHHLRWAESEKQQFSHMKEGVGAGEGEEDEKAAFILDRRLEPHSVEGWDRGGRVGASRRKNNQLLPPSPSAPK